MATPLLIQQYSVDQRQFYVINDAEKFEAGSKEKALPTLIDLAKKYSVLIYVGPKNGYAQIAVAKACHLTGCKSVLFLQSFDDTETSMTRRARGYNAEINYRSLSLKDIDAEAKTYIKQHGGYLVEFGLMERDICLTLEQTLKEEVSLTQFPSQVKRIWLAAGSCTLLNTLYKVFPHSQFLVIQVGKTIWPDMYNSSNTTIFKSNLPFTTPTDILPPYPSIATYDAKIWSHVLKHGQSGDYIINVGKE